MVNFSATKVAFGLALYFGLTTGVSARTAGKKVDLDSFAKRLKIVGAITHTVDDRVVGIVVIKDTKTHKTDAVEIGKAFMIDKQVLQLVRQDGKTIILSNGAEQVALELKQGVPADPKKAWAGDRPRNQGQPKIVQPAANQAAQTTEVGVVTAAQNIRQVDDDVDLAQGEIDEMQFAEAVDMEMSYLGDDEAYME